MTATPHCWQCLEPLRIVYGWTGTYNIELNPPRWECPNGHPVGRHAVAR